MAEFTIITPVLNGAAYLERCILSVAEQDMDVQYVIMDGGSTDGTLDIIAKYKQLIHHWESTSDQGQSDAINKGLKIASGRICNWLNADDMLCQGALQTVSALMNDTTHVVIGKCMHVKVDGSSIGVGGTQLYDTLEQTIGRYSMGQPSHFYRTSIVRKLGSLQVKLHYAMDMELWLRYLLIYGQESVRATDDILSRFTVHEHSKSHRYAEEMYSEKYQLFHSLLSLYPMSECLAIFFEQYPETANDFKHRPELNFNLLQAHICYPLLSKMLMERNRKSLSCMLHIVNEQGLHSAWNRILWELRLLNLRFTA